MLINHIDNSISKANSNQSALNQDILNLQGFSGTKTRHLYNNICNLADATYLEIGTYKGSTFISSLYNNSVYGIAIDNWSEFDGSYKICQQNIKNFIPSNQYKLIQKDAFSITEKDIELSSIDVYLYDGEHSYLSQYQAITYFEKFLSDISIILIDDFRTDGNWKQVVDGTYDGLKASNLEVLYHKVLESKQETNGRDNYWNGCGIFLCKKK